MSAALAYSKLAAIYDDYCVFTGDIPFFRAWAAKTPGHILELMAGTGRVSLPLIEDGARLTCVDNSISMLVVLQRKLRSTGRKARLICAEVCQLPLRGQFPLILLPFQGLTELAAADARLNLLLEAARLLAPSGRFVCTSHNPAARLRTVDDQWHDVGVSSRSNGDTIRISLRTRYDELAGDVVGQQRLVITAPSGETSEVALDLRFALVSLGELTRLAEQAGLRIVDLQGDYDGGLYDASSSPVIIAVLEKAA